MSAKEWDDTWS